MTDSFAFVLNLLDYTDSLPLELAPGVFLDHATEVQSKGIRQFLQDYEKSFVGGTWMYFVKPLHAKLASGEKYTRIPPDRAKFWVINYSGSPTTVWRLCDVSQLTASELEIGVTFHPNRTDSIQQVDPLRIFHFSQGHLDPIVTKTSGADLLRMEQYRKTVEDFQNSKADSKVAVGRIFKDFVSLSKGPRFGGLVLLGHFALIEALITHDPHKFGDSLNHQLSTKMPLLMKKFETPIDPANYFELTDERKIWKQLYEVRSLIAHGGHRSSKKNPFGKTKSDDAVPKFVRDSLKQLLIFALREPELVFDLKVC